MTDAETRTEMAAKPEATPAADAKGDKTKDGESWFGGCCGLSEGAKDKGKSTKEVPTTSSTTANLADERAGDFRTFA